MYTYNDAIRSQSGRFLFTTSLIAFLEVGGNTIDCVIHVLVDIFIWSSWILFDRCAFYVHSSLETEPSFIEVCVEGEPARVMVTRNTLNFRF